MFEQTGISAPSRTTVFPAADGQPREVAHSQHASAHVERLPFSVRLVRNAEDLDKAVAIRHAAYARHVPEFAEKLRVPEPADFEDGVAVLLAESKLDGSPLGTMRIQTNQYKPLSVEQSVELPEWLKYAALAEVTRLGVANDRVGNLVKTTLVKASFQYCEQMGIDWAIVTARSPLDRQYERLMFEDLYPGQGYIPMQHVGNLPHRVLGFDIHTGEARWSQAKHPLLRFFCYTNHPDIDIRSSASEAQPPVAGYPEQPLGAAGPRH